MKNGDGIFLVCSVKRAKLFLGSAKRGFIQKGRKTKKTIIHRHTDDRPIQSTNLKIIKKKIHSPFYVCIYCRFSSARRIWRKMPFCSRLQWTMPGLSWTHTLLMLMSWTTDNLVGFFLENTSECEGHATAVIVNRDQERHMGNTPNSLLRPTLFQMKRSKNIIRNVPCLFDVVFVDVHERERWVK